MTNYKIITTDEKSGISLVAAGKSICAFLNGKYYRTSDYRPITGDGRQLRADSQEVINRLLPIAREKIERLEAQEAAEREKTLEALRAEAAKGAPTKSFADALQDAFLTTLTEKAAGDMSALIYPEVEKMVVEKFGLVPKVHEIRIPERPVYSTTEVLHKDFDNILNMLLDGEGVYLCGPAGTGKSYIAMQAAAALGVDYYESNAITDETKVTGFIDANGRYHETEFYKAFVNGGVFLLDELDASIPEVLTLLNNALANGSFAFPTGKVKAHDNFYCLAAGNTYGTGADNQYTGRYQLDAASMDRFALIPVDYDERIEKSLCNDDATLVDFAHDFRAAVNSCGVSCLCTYRAIKRLYKFISYMDKQNALRIALLKGLPADDCRLIYNNLKNKDSEWARALYSLTEVK